jgi:hypothetical protein
MHLRLSEPGATPSGSKYADPLKVMNRTLLLTVCGTILSEGQTRPMVMKKIRPPLLKNKHPTLVFATLAGLWLAGELTQ